MPVIRIEKNANYTTMSNGHLRDKNLSLKAKGLLSIFLSLPESWTYSVSGLSKICKEGRNGIGSTLRELEAAGYLVRERQRDEHGLLGDNTYIIYEKPIAVASDAPKSESQSLYDVDADDGGECENVMNAEDAAFDDSETDLDEADSDAPKSGNPDMEHPVMGKPDMEQPVMEQPVMENPSLDSPSQENRAQINKDSRNSRPRTQNSVLAITDLNKKREDGRAHSRRRYGRYGNVLLSDADLYALQKEFPDDYASRIERLSEYMASTGKTYKSHLATIRSWAWRDKTERRAKEQDQAANGYSHEKYRHREGESL